MKLKLFIFSLFALLSLVGYKTYVEYSSLKSIGSYESCVTAKGSRIQESYPSTCITRLGARFTSIVIKSELPAENIYINQKYNFSFNYPTRLFSLSEFPVTDSEKYEYEVVLHPESVDLLPTLSDISLNIGTERLENLIKKSMKPYQLGRVAAWREEVVIAYQEGSSYWIRIVFEMNDKIYEIQANLANPPNQQDIDQINQILSTFKFTN